MTSLNVIELIKRYVKLDLIPCALYFALQVEDYDIKVGDS